MKVLALDLATTTGWAVLEGQMGQDPKLLAYGTWKTSVKDFDLSYPWNYMRVGRHIGALVGREIQAQIPDMIVIEQTNLGKSRETQKMLEFIHCCVLDSIESEMEVLPQPQVVYLSTSTWRKAVGLWLSKDQKKANSKLSKAKSAARQKGVKLDKKALGIRGRTTWKHLAVERVNAQYGLGLKQKDDDVADAVLLGESYFKNVQPCNGE